MLLKIARTSSSVPHGIPHGSPPWSAPRLYAARSAGPHDPQSTYQEVMQVRRAPLEFAYACGVTTVGEDHLILLLLFVHVN